MSHGGVKWSGAPKEKGKEMETYSMTDEIMKGFWDNYTEVAGEAN